MRILAVVCLLALGSCEDQAENTESNNAPPAEKPKLPTPDPAIHGSAKMVAEAYVAAWRAHDLNGMQKCVHPDKWSVVKEAWKTSSDSTAATDHGFPGMRFQLDDTNSQAISATLDWKGDMYLEPGRELKTLTVTFTCEPIDEHWYILDIQDTKP